MAGLSGDDPIYISIKDVVESAEGRAAALASAAQGKPALCDVDKLLQAKLGAKYQVADTGTKCAGSLVASVMRAEGYKKGPPRRMDPDCVAKTAILWVPPTA